MRLETVIIAGALTVALGAAAPVQAAPSGAVLGSAAVASGRTGAEQVIYRRGHTRHYFVREYRHPWWWQFVRRHHYRHHWR